MNTISRHNAFRLLDEEILPLQCNMVGVWAKRHLFRGAPHKSRVLSVIKRQVSSGMAQITLSLAGKGMSRADEPMPTPSA